MKFFKSKQIAFGALLIIFLVVAASWYKLYSNMSAKTSNKKPVVAVEDKQIPGQLELVVLSEPVFITLPKSNEPVAITNAVEVKAGTIVTTGDTGRAELRYPNKSVTRLNYNTELEVRQIDENPQQSILKLIQGSIWNRVSKLLGKDSFTTETETMVATVRGTAYRMGVLDDGTNVMMVKEGAVGVDMTPKTEEPDEEDVVMKEDMRMSFNPEQNTEPVMQEMTADEDDEWTNFNEQQDKKWMEQNKSKFSDVLGENTQNANEDQGGIGEEIVINTPVLSDCTGPDGILFRSSKEDCDNLNNFWKTVNPPKTTNAPNNGPTGVPATATPVPTAIPTVPPATPTITPTPTPDTGTSEGQFRIFVDCVEVNADGTYFVYFDYELLQQQPVFLFISRLEGGEGSVPSILTPNNNSKTIKAIGNQTSRVVWIADNFSAVASIESPKCVTAAAVE